MQSQNLLKISTANIALYYHQINETIFQDNRFTELMNFLLSDSNFMKYSYAFYTDNYMIKNNIFIPSFHTMYLSSGNKSVFIDKYEDLWLIDAFKNNEYFMIGQPKQDVSSFNINIIPNIRSVL